MTKILPKCVLLSCHDGRLSSIMEETYNRRIPISCGISYYNRKRNATGYRCVKAAYRTNNGS